MAKTISKEAIQRVQGKIFTGIRSVVQTVFLRRYRVLQVLLIITAALISTIVVSRALFTTVPVAQEAGTSVRLDIDAIDEMELLIEVRNTTLENPPAIPGRVFGL